MTGRLSPMPAAGSPAIGPIGLDDVDAMVKIHLRAFPASELGLLGTEAVRRHYRWQLTGPHDLSALGAFVDGRLVGFLLGGRFRGSTSGFVRSHLWFLVGRALRRPRLIMRASGRRVVGVAMGQLWRRRGAAPERPGRVPDRSFGVLVIAVDPEAHRMGVGSALLEGAEIAARRGGFERLHLTLNPGNVAALAFYADHGWERAGLPGDSEDQWLIAKELAPPLQGA